MFSTNKKVIVSLIIIGVVFVGGFISNHIPFIYFNQIYLILIIGYLILGLWFINFISYQHKINKKEVNKLITKRWALYALVLIFPLLAGWAVSSSTPIVAEFLFHQADTKNYRIIRIDMYGQGGKTTSNLTIVDAQGKHYSLTLSKNYINSIGIKPESDITIQGRSTFIGLVVDKINGVPRSYKTKTRP